MVAGHKRLKSLFRKEIDRVRRDHDPLKIDNAFVLWFADAYIVGDRSRAFEGIIGGPGDKTIDAVYIDERNRIIHLVQGKYHQTPSSDDSEVYAFARRAGDLHNEAFGDELEHAGPGARKRLGEAHRILHGSGKVEYQVRMYFATTGRVSGKCRKKAMRISAASGNTTLEVLDQQEVFALFADWLEGSSPPLPELEIGVDGPYTLMHQENDLQGWIFTTSSQEMSRLHRTAGERIFARNVRGYLGSDKAINREISRTARNRPELFWFLNNGVTIIADHVEKRDSGKQVRMQMRNPQIVNGQQTVRTLAAAGRSDARLLVRLIRLRQEAAKAGIVGLVGEVVRATNRQNAIKQADLMANDAEQVRIERECRQLNYAYERKRQDPREFAEKGFKYRKVRREDLANALAATLVGPHMVRRTEQWETKYGRLFSEKRPITDYLARWWASRRVASTRSIPIEARWVVLACLWNWSDAPFRDCVSREAHRLAFLRACQDDNDMLLRHFDRAARNLFACAKSVYVREKRIFGAEVKHAGKPFRVLTPDAFFRREHVGDAVMKAARGDGRRRSKITSLLKQFKTKLLDSL